VGAAELTGELSACLRAWVRIVSPVSVRRRDGQRHAVDDEIDVLAALPTGRDHPRAGHQRQPIRRGPNV
jgi:hypothetical protein